MKKTLFCDVETTGLGPVKHGVVQIAMLMDIDGYVEDRLVVKCQPFLKDYIEYEKGMPSGEKGKETKWLNFAMDLNDEFEPKDYKTPTGIPIAEILTYPEPEEVFPRVIAFLDKWINKFDKQDKAYFGAYNAKFDHDFLQAWFVKNGSGFFGSYINHRLLDPLLFLYARDWQGLIFYPNYKLPTVCDIYGIALEAHNPLSDIEATRELWYQQTGSTNIKPCCVCGKRGDQRGPDRINWYCALHYDIDVKGRQ